MNHFPRKRFAQHFLCDPAVIAHIIDVFAPEALQHVVEIGPGQGALTVPLLKILKQLEVVELDRDLIPELNRRAHGLKGELIIHSADALTFDFAALKKDERLLRIIGNLPYHISTPLIFHFLSYASYIADMLFMLQKEVAKRLAAEANSKDYGRLSVMVQYHCEVNLLFDVSSNAFFPPPQVKSSMIHLSPYRDYPYLAKDYALFEKIVRQAFGHRRKTLRNSLKQLIPDEVWTTIETHSDLRAENLTVKDFVALSNAVSEKSS